MEKQIKIGAISATRQFLEAAARIGKQQGVDVVVANAGLEATIDFGRQMEEDGVDAIIGWRAGADFLQRSRSLKVPILSVHISSYDLLENILEAKKISRAILLPNFRNQLSRIDLLSQLFDVSLVAKAFHDSKTLEEVIRWGKHQGCGVVIGGGVTMELAHRHGLAGVAFQVNEEAMALTLRDAIAIARLNRQNQARSANYRSIIDAFAEGMVSVDAAGRITALNHTALDLLKLTQDQAVGEEISRFVAGESIRTVLRTGRPLWDTIEKIGEETYVVNHIPLIMESRIAGAVMTFTAVSKLMQSESKVRRSLAKRFQAKYTCEDFVYRCDKMKVLMQKTLQYARTEATVLITGETGTGKEILAQSMHNASSRRRGPFVSINCAALPDQLLESELFGHEEGAFTGARRGGKPGLFELAHNGTIFLDEIGEMPLLLQSRLLRVLQEREVMRIGGDHLIPVDVRVIAATNRSLCDKVREGLFREDLLFRLNVLSLHIPPLRERIEDIPLLIDKLLKKSAAKFRVASFAVPSLCEQKLMQLNWPGNVRQLQNTMEKLVILSGGQWSAAAFDEIHEELINYSQAQNQDMGARSRDFNDTLRQMLLEDEAKRISRTLQDVAYSKSKAAKKLGISRTTLWRKLKEMNAGP